MTRISITIPGVPRAWSRARHDGRSGRFFNASPLRAFQDEVRLRARAAMSGAPPITGPVAVTVRAFLPVPPSWSAKRRADALAAVVVPTARPDLDNYAKGLCDALNGIVFKDDAQASDLLALKRYAVTPRLEVEVAARGAGALAVALEHFVYMRAAGISPEALAAAMGRSVPPGVQIQPSTLVAWIADAWLSLGTSQRNAVTAVTPVTVGGV